MRINSRGGDDLARIVHDGDLDAGAKSGVESERRSCSGRRGEQESAQIAGEDVDRFILRQPKQSRARIDAQMQLDLGAPRQRTVSASQRSPERPRSSIEKRRAIRLS